MKINPIGKVDYVLPTQPSAQKVREQKTRTESRDEVTFSADARSFSKAFGAAKAAVSEPTDKSRIEEVKAQVNAGTYFVETDKIAESILTGKF